MSARLALFLGTSGLAAAVAGYLVLRIEGNHGDAVAHVKRTIRPQDLILDVEAYLQGPLARPAVVGSLEMLGARWVG